MSDEDKTLNDSLVFFKLLFENLTTSREHTLLLLFSHGLSFDFYRAVFNQLS